MATTRRPHALVVPGPGQGHINACMRLAEALSGIGFSISFVFFSASYGDLKQQGRLPSKLLQADGSSNNNNYNIRVHVVEDGIDKLVEEEEEEEAGCRRKRPSFAATDAMRDNLASLITSLSEQGSPVTCLVSDSFAPWTQHVADRLALPRVDYWTSTALAYLFVANIPLLHEKGLLPEKRTEPARWKSENPAMVDCIPGLPPFPMELYPQDIRFAEFTSPSLQFFVELGRQSRRAERLLIHTVAELEPVALESHRKAGISTYAVGPLLSFPSDTSKQIRDGGEEEEESIKWLHTQAPSSVIYIAFGTFAILSSNDLFELASGLEMSHQPFLWAIRPKSYEGELSQLLPQGFLSRTKDRGLVTGWAPQEAVLAHPSIGGFLSHCGWNSTLESLYAGVPILGCPGGADQRSNAHYIAEVWKVGFELERTVEGGLDRNHVEKGVLTLMKEDEGKKARDKAKEIMEIAKITFQDGGHSRNNLYKFYEDMKEHCHAY